MAVDVALERRRLSSEERRSGILAAARDVFARRGFHGGGTSEIAAMAGCSEPMLYKHFASKQALFAAVLMDAGEDMCRRVDAMTDEAHEVQLGHLPRIFDMLRDDPAVLAIVRLRILAVTLAAEDPEIREALAETTTRMRTRVAGMIARHQELGLVRRDVDPVHVAWVWFGIVVAAGVHLAANGDEGRATLPPIPETLLLMLTPHPQEG